MMKKSTHPKTNTSRTNISGSNTSKTNTPGTYIRRKPSVLRMILKLFVVFFLALFLFAGVLVAMDDAEWASYEADEAKKVNSCDRYYYNKDYGRLLDELDLYNLYGETYEIYWEIVDGYEDYLCWQQWSRVSESEDPDAAVKAAYYADRVRGNAENVVYEKNQRALEQWKNIVENAQQE